MSTPTCPACALTERIASALLAREAAAVEAGRQAGIEETEDAARRSIDIRRQLDAELAEDRLRAAVEAERERCAGIASGYPAFSAFGDYHGHAIPAAIAAAIRFNGAKQ